jgi:hypothetical protein
VKPFVDELKPITAADFKKRLAQLCLTSNTVELPRRQRDRYILLESLSLYFDKDISYTEAAVNTLIETWRAEVGRTIGLDHVTLRRTLVDEGYLTRSRMGDSYRRNVTPNGADLFAADVADVDPRAAIQDAMNEIEVRRLNFNRCKSDIGEPAEQ